MPASDTRTPATADRRRRFSPHGPDHVVRQIEADFALITSGMQAIPAPSGHAWDVSASELSWFGGDVIASTSLGGASIFLRRVPHREADPNQLHIELRLFWDMDRRVPETLPELRAILWVQHGEQIDFRSRSLLPARAVFLYAGDAEVLLRQASTVITGALQPFVADALPR